MPPKEQTDMLPENGKVLSAEEGEEKIYAGSGDGTSLGLLKQALVAAGYRGEIARYRSGTWFEAACSSGIIRDADGNAVRYPADKKFTAAEREKSAEQILLSNSNFYIANRDEPSFTKFSYDPVKETLGSAQYKTPDRIRRPWLIQMFLAYCGFHIEAVEKYNKEKAQLADNPLYNSLHSQKAKDRSLNFTRAALGHDINSDPKEYTDEDLRAVKFRARIQSANIRKKLDSGNPLDAQEMEDLFMNRVRRHLRNPAALSEFDENPDLEKTLRRNFSNRENVRELVNGKGDKKDIAAAQQKFIEEYLDNTAVKLWNVSCGEKNRLPVPPTGKLHEKKNQPKEEPFPGDVPEEDEMIKDEGASEPEKESADDVPEVKEKAQSVLNNDAKEDVQAPVKEDAGEKIPSAVKEEVKPDVQSAVKEEDGGEKDEVLRGEKDSAPDEIKMRIADLERRRQLYPEHSPMETAIASAIESLSRVSEKGLPDDPFDAAYAEKTAAVTEAAGKLVALNRMENALRSDDTRTARLLTTPDESGRVAAGFAKLDGVKAVSSKLGHDPAEKLTRLLSDDRELDRFAVSVMREIRDNPKGSLIPDGAVVHGHVYKQAGVRGWQRMPGATEQQVAESVAEIAEMPSSSRMFRNIAAAETAAAKNKPSADREAEAYLLGARIAELTQLTRGYPKNSVMSALGQNALAAMNRLRETGLPDNPASPVYEAQQRAYRNAVAGVCALQRAQRSARTAHLLEPLSSDMSGQIAGYADAFKNSEMLNRMVEADNQGIRGRFLKGEIGRDGVLSTLSGEQKYRQSHGIPETAERKGVLWRMGPNERWRQIPGASLKEVNDSYLTVCDEKHTAVMVSRQRSAENVRLSDSSKINPATVI